MRKFLALILGLVFSCCFFVGCGEDWWSSIILEPENQEQENEGDQGGSENEGDQGGSENEGDQGGSENEGDQGGSENEGDQGGSENEGDQGGSGDEDEPDEEDWWTDFL